ADGVETFLYGGNERCAGTGEGVENYATGWGDQSAQVAHQLDRLHGGMIILHLTAHRTFRPRSLGNIEKAACTAAFVLDSDTIIRVVRPSMVSLGARSASCWSRPSLPNATLPIQHRRRFFVEDDVCGETP